MKLNIKKTEDIWQIGSGNNDRDYSEILFDFGIACIGGYPHDSKINSLRKIQPGNWVVLKKGRKQIIAVGEVISGYARNEKLLHHIDGWDLSNFIKVKWYKPKEVRINFEKSLLYRGKISRVRNKDVLIKINNTNFYYVSNKYNIEDLKMPDEINDKDIIKAFENKINKDSEKIVYEVDKIKKLIDWYQKNDNHVLEHEIRTFLVIPLLKSLGWSEKHIKIEYRNTDISLFKHPYNSKSKVVPLIIFETKRFNKGLKNSYNQIKKYAKQFPECNKLVTTDGVRYSLYEKSVDNKEFSKQRTAYFNVMDMRKNDYLYPDVGGAIDFLMKISNVINGSRDRKIE